MKKQGSVLIIVLLVSSVILFLLLSSSEIIRIKNKKEIGEINVKINDNIRGNALMIAKHEVSICNKILELGLVFNKTNSNSDSQYSRPIKDGIYNYYDYLDASDNFVYLKNKHFTGIKPKDYFSTIDGVFNTSILPRDAPWIIHEEIDNNKISKRIWDVNKNNLNSLINYPLYTKESITNYRLYQILKISLPSNKILQSLINESTGDKVILTYRKQIEIDNEIYNIDQIFTVILKKSSFLFNVDQVLNKKIIVNKVK